MNRMMKMTKTISITSGKGGVGKSTLVANTAIDLAKKGNRVLILDGDLGMANIDIMFGVRVEHSIEKVFKGEMSIEDVIVEVADNVYLIPGGSGVYDLNNLSIEDKSILMNQINGLNGHFDYMIVDTAPGIDDKVLYLNSAAQEIVVVLTPDPSSLTDSYALIKMLHQRYREQKFSIICNMVKDEIEAKMIFRRLLDVVERFLCVSLRYKGFVPLDPSLRMANKTQRLIVEFNPRSPSSLGIKEFSRKINSYNYIGHYKGGLQFFWEHLVGVA